MLSLCDSDGTIDVSAYRALRDDVTIGEAMDLEAVRCILGDRRAAFQAWYPRHAERERTNTRARAVDGAPSGSEMHAEIERRTEALGKLTELTGAHRAAVACAISGQAEPPGRLPLASLDEIEGAIASHREVLAYLAAKVSDDH